MILFLYYFHACNAWLWNRAWIRIVAWICIVLANPLSILNLYLSVRGFARIRCQRRTKRQWRRTTIPGFRTLVVSSKNCLADLLIGSYVWISWWVNYKQTILAVVYFRSAGTLPCGHWSVAKKVYETGEAADNIQVFFSPDSLHFI